MQPVPFEPTGGGAPHVDVGAFEQGTPVSRWALARYLVGRAVAESVSLSLVLLALAGIALAVVSSTLLHSVFLAVVFVLLALAVLILRALVRAVLRRLTAVGPLDRRLRALVADTRRDVLRELRRVGLPGRTWSLPLLAPRLLSARRRGDTLERLRAFEVERVVSRARLDELHLLLQGTARASGVDR